MGKKSQKKSTPPPKEMPKKLSPQKRHELDQLIDRLFKLGFKQTTAPSEQWNEYLEIQGTLDRIQAIESVLKVKTSVPKTRTTAIDTFCKWCEENGAQFEGVNISEFPGFELGLEAAKDFKKGELVITVPKQIIMSEEALTSYLEPIVTEIPLLDSMTNVKLAFGILLEKLKSDSFWKPYLDMLPERHSTVMYFTVNDMQELKGSNVLGQALNQCKSIARQYAFIHKCVQKVEPKKFGPDSTGKETFETLKEKFTYELYRWAVSTVMTRQNAIPRTKPEVASVHTANLMPALIPLWDLANHKEGSFSSSYNLEQDRLESCALSDYGKDDQIFIYYGDRSNADFLIHNGWASSMCRHISTVLGLKWELRGKEHLEKERPCIIVSNHQSSLDILGMFDIWHVMDKCTVVAKQELFYAWPFGLAAWLSGLIFINRVQSKQAHGVLHTATDHIKLSNIKLWVFPEGTRRNTGKIHSFKKGAFHMAVEGQIPIVPVVYSSYMTFLDDNNRVLNPGDIIISTLAAIPTEGLKTDDIPQLMEKVHQVMSEEYKKISEEIFSRVKTVSIVNNISTPTMVENSYKKEDKPDVRIKQKGLRNVIKAQ